VQPQFCVTKTKQSTDGDSLHGDICKGEISFAIIPPFFIYFSEEVPDLGRAVEICTLVHDFKLSPCSECCVLSSG